ncbi:hypothetical protein B0A49_00931 [Cryomyces minteri]|uniref:YDG domain-containing protein n=1 Tax=Cryomyces minteri TaxID=331657 RepID=A0A4U0XR01_9PEZI|nr:hypothetical protein B0A49_00931 [Cryomyces minteri]
MEKSVAPFTPQFLRAKARWIRDDLDPVIAREGPDIMHPDDVLTLHELLQDLRRVAIPVELIRYSRIHKAILDIAGKATRWPGKLIDQCDALIVMWEKQFGPLEKLGTPLYETGGRLQGICKPEDLSNETLLANWVRSPKVAISPSRARRHGDLGFRAGDWWINPMFAFYDGIIDSGDPDGGIVADEHGAYAVVMTDGDEIWGPTPSVFIYRSRLSDRGRYRLTAADEDARHPVRVLRSHSLRSLWSPRAGIRFEGLFRVVGWSITCAPVSTTSSNVHPSTIPPTSRPHGVRCEWIYDITFERDVEIRQPAIEDVLTRPWAEEVEDYKEYKRLRKQHRESRSRKDGKGKDGGAGIGSGLGGKTVTFEHHQAVDDGQAKHAERLRVRTIAAGHMLDGMSWTEATNDGNMDGWYEISPSSPKGRIDLSIWSSGAVLGDVDGARVGSAVFARGTEKAKTFVQEHFGFS